MADLAGLLQLCERADGLLDWHRGIDGVELIEVDALALQALEARLARALEMLGTAIGVPAPGARPQQPALGRDDETGGVGMERLGDERLAHRGAIGIGGVDEGHAARYHPAQKGHGILRIGGPAPTAAAGDVEGAEAQPVDHEVAADREGRGESRHSISSVGGGPPSSMVPQLRPKYSGWFETCWRAALRSARMRPKG